MNYNNFLKDNFFLFSGIDNLKKEAMLAFDGIEYEQYLPGEIIHNSKHNEKIGVILKGKATINSGDDGVIIRKLSVGDTYGAASLFDNPTYLTYVSATSSCLIATFNKEFVEKCIAFDSMVAKNYITFLSKRITFLNSKINSYTAKNAESKLYSYLLQLPRNGDGAVTLPVSLSTLAKMIGIGRASLYRAFDKLEGDGVISKNDKNIILKEV